MDEDGNLVVLPSGELKPAKSDFEGPERFAEIAESETAGCMRETRAAEEWMQECNRSALGVVVRHKYLGRAVVLVEGVATMAVVSSSFHCCSFAAAVAAAADSFVVAAAAARYCSFEFFVAVGFVVAAAAEARVLVGSAVDLHQRSSLR